MPDELNALLIVSLVICGGSGLALFALWRYLSGKTKDMAVDAISEFEKQQGDDELIDPDAPIEPRQERKLSDVLREKTADVDFDEALQQHQMQPDKNTSSHRADKRAGQPPPPPESDILQPGDPLVEHNERPDENPMPPQTAPNPHDNDNTTKE
jgi:hypothetical protein